jgi:hypothetical protein
MTAFTLQALLSYCIPVLMLIPDYVEITCEKLMETHQNDIA